MEKKDTKMKLTVDLQCRKCYKKVKKVLCKYPQIRDQQYDEKTGTVTIRVICCNPEKLRDNLCREGGGFIKRIEIVQPPPSTPPSTPSTTPPTPPPSTPPTPPPTIRDRPCLPPAFLVWPFYEDGSGGAPSFYEKRIWDSYGYSGTRYENHHHEYFFTEEQASSGCMINCVILMIYILVIFIFIL